MTHTKEPWEFQPAHEDGSVCIIGSDLGGLVGAAHGWPTEIDSGDFTRVEANAARIVSCVNALAGIPDPAAFVQAARGMKALLERVLTEATFDPDLSDDICEALAAFRAQMGEAP